MKIYGGGRFVVHVSAFPLELGSVPPERNRRREHSHIGVTLGYYSRLIRDSLSIRASAYLHFSRKN